MRKQSHGFFSFFLVGFFLSLWGSYFQVLSKAMGPPDVVKYKVVT